ncbi:MAG: GDSL-type esterase/lipase family protein [Flavobacteriales bacterium]|nr:GDSL-type esterase/lipase family protein [Flavobacteriales bacterium]
MKTKFTKEFIIILLTLLLGFVLIRENYFERVLTRFQSKKADKKESVRKDLDELYCNNQFKSEIVFLGNSITEAADWNELLGLNIANHGVGGQTLSQMLGRVDNVIKEEPKYVFIMGGINDIYQNVPIEESYKTYLAVIKVLRDHNITPIIQSTLYVSSSEKEFERKNALVKELNTLMSEYCIGDTLIYVDINSKLSDNVELLEKYHTDGIHLTAFGYDVWSKELISILTNFNCYQ